PPRGGPADDQPRRTGSGVRPGLRPAPEADNADPLRAIELVRLRRDECDTAVQEIRRIVPCHGPSSLSYEDRGLHQAGSHARMAAPPERFEDVDPRAGRQLRNE